MISASKTHIKLWLSLNKTDLIPLYVENISAFEHQFWTMNLEQIMVKNQVFNSSFDQVWTGVKLVKYFKNNSTSEYQCWTSRKLKF